MPVADVTRLRRPAIHLSPAVLTMRQARRSWCFCHHGINFPAIRARGSYDKLLLNHPVPGDV